MNKLSDIVNDNNFLKIEGFNLDKLFLKLEALNPAGSIKMKTAVSMVTDFEKKGKINSETILIESSSGSLGVALSLICSERRYKFTCVVDPNTSHNNIKMMEALGASVVIVEKRDENGGFLGTRIAYITDILKRDSRYQWFNQYANEENPNAHARTTAHSIYINFEQVDYLFVGAGTTGTLMGCVNYFRRHSPNTKIVAVDSVGSVTFGLPAGKRFIPGLGTSRCPEIFSSQDIFSLELVEEAEAIRMCRYLALSQGLLAGGSTGTVMACINAWRHRLPPDATIVAISPDLGERYLDTIYDDSWVTANFGTDALAIDNLVNSSNTNYHLIDKQMTSKECAWPISV